MNTSPVNRRQLGILVAAALAGTAAPLFIGNYARIVKQAMNGAAKA